MRLIVSALGLLLASSSAKAEFFVNPFAGMTVFDSTVTVGGTKLVDQGGDAPTYGLRAGWINTGAFHYGAEVEGFLASGRSRAVVNGRGYSYELDWGAGAYARIGWRTRGNAIFFARAGVLTTNQDTRPDFGLGAEIPFAPNVAARIDIGYSPADVEYYRLTGGLVWRF